MKLSLFILVFVCLGCSKNAYKIDKSAKVEPQFSMEATQFSNEVSVLKSVMKTNNDSSEVIVLNYDSRVAETIKTKKDSIK